MHQAIRALGSGMRAACAARARTLVPSSDCASPDGNVMPFSVKPSLLVSQPTICAYGSRGAAHGTPASPARFSTTTATPSARA